MIVVEQRTLEFITSVATHALDFQNANVPQQQGRVREGSAYSASSSLSHKL
ncbi:hypothetical protein GJ744_001637 [Endocarpon pusillum]|uniref:Uncharacterized protein n=1 Tax=Endocarpon pusillum TaxID=364733 RepID=A0A8H7ABA5_9EURO|nr:hypothetical protein GJ744_001637 [Endocarpon pusillum]